MSEPSLATETNGRLAPQQDELPVEGSSERTGRPNPSKRPTDSSQPTAAEDDRDSKRRKGVAPIKSEYLRDPNQDFDSRGDSHPAHNDDAAEASHHRDRQPAGSNNAKRGGKQKQKGQNTNRHFGSARDEIQLCGSRSAVKTELAENSCEYGEGCRFEHDIRKYLDAKGEDLTVFGGICPVWEATGRCDVGWKCRFLRSHVDETVREDGSKELVLVEREGAKQGGSTVNGIDMKERIRLTKKQFPLPRSDEYLQWLDTTYPDRDPKNGKQNRPWPRKEKKADRNSSSPEPARSHEDEENNSLVDQRSTYISPPLLPSEKRRLYFGPETPVLAPLTTQGNLPFRRLCASLGATFTYSEMAMSFPLLQGQKSEWALIKAHESELQPPTFTVRARPLSSRNETARQVVYDYDRPEPSTYGYDQSKDLQFSAQISASKPWLALRATEALTSLLPGGLRSVDLNCGCPIDLVYREGAGSALMDSPAKLAKILRGMNFVSGEVPVSCKIRMGTKDKVPTAQKLVERLVLGNQHGNDGGQGTPPAGVAAITLHGRSRQQRYTKSADWEYIHDTSRLIASLNAKADQLTDTAQAPDDRDLPNGQGLGTSTAGSRRAPTFFLGNGDIYSSQHYYQHLAETQCDGMMLARGALIKPWIFEEIRDHTTVDKRSAERLAYIESFVQYGLDAWGSDTMGLHTTRRFLMEWLSFTCRYVPVGLLERLPAELNERAPAWRGRDELEDLLASTDSRDWDKIASMFLGPAGEGFRFVPKHKSNSYENAEG